MEEKVIYKRFCQRCGGYFFSENSKAYVCPGCKKRKPPVKDRKNQKNRNLTDCFSIRQIILLLMRYNRKNKTDYSYGQFIEAIRNGSITKEDLIE